MYLFDPNNYTREHSDERSKDVALKTIEFFENKGLKKIKEDDQAAVWYEDFLEFIKKEKVFAAMLTPSGYGAEDSRWDMWRISHYNEILGFYGLCYWYAWQVSILGLGPIWMGDNEDAKHKAAKALEEGGIFAFGLSEKEHGADLYSTEMTLEPAGDGTYKANGSKYYIGNGNCAAMVSTFGKIKDTGEYVFFAVDPEHECYECVKKINTSGVRQAYVAEYALHDYPITDKDILSRGKLAWESSLNTVNVGKFELGFASMGICTHAFYEAVNHAANRNLYGRYVTDFPHVKRILTDAYARLVAMKLCGMRAADYMRAASNDDRRYLLYNPIVKMKVCSQGEKVVSLLHEVIVAKGYEQDTYFEMALRDIGMLAKLEGTEHVNMALIIKFMANYFFNPKEYPELPRRNDPVNDSYLFNQYLGGLKNVQFPDYRKPYQGVEIANVLKFREQLELFKKMLITAAPNEEQQKNIDFMLAGGELFTLICYAQLLLENVKIYNVEDDLVDQIFDFLIRDFSNYALAMVTNHECTPEQEALFMEMIKKPVRDNERFNRVWEKHVYSLKDKYRMRDE